MVPVTGEPFVWVLALPALGAFLLANIGVGRLAALSSRESKRRLWWLITGGAWLLTIFVDCAHH
jgi:hypothetical protein